MAGALPPEIWAQILVHLPFACLHTIGHVNRTLYRLCRDMQRSVLDVTVHITDQEGETELDKVTKRLRATKIHPELIKKLCLSTIRINPREYHPPITIVKKSKPTPERLSFLKRITRKKEENPQNLPEDLLAQHVRLVSYKTRNIENALASLIPSLSSVRELDFHQRTFWEGPWFYNFTLALKVTGAHLRVLSLRFSLSSGLGSTVFGIGDSVVSIELPVLHTLNIYVNTYPSGDFESGISKFIAASPRLQEIQYRVNAYRYRVHTPSHFTIIPATTLPHLSLKTFKWFTAPSTIPVTNIFTAHASGYEVVHLNPVPSIQALRLLNVDLLIELRVDLSWFSDITQFASFLAHATQLVVLEIAWWPYGTPVQSPVHLFPDGGIVKLEKLYLDMSLRFLNPQMLGNLALRTPNLRTLALISEFGSGEWMYRTDSRILHDNCSALVKDFSRSPVLKWELCDFGIVLREWGKVNISERSPLMPLLRVISQTVPSITSFYGTGSLKLWEGMQCMIGENWCGELWSQKYACWE
ncbi:hypothetical protein DL96DRAFT_1635783 [Flagelloscypha sp. PMI_526]|nr:hypothetical protein DL96DRAFT_1635783 [Flagelloscypha sp. PMI_526]